MVVVGQSDQVSMRRTNVGEREIHVEPLDSEQVYKGDWQRLGGEEDPKFAPGWPPESPRGSLICRGSCRSHLSY